MKVRIHEIYPLKDVARAHNVSLPMWDFTCKISSDGRDRISKVERLWESCS